MRCERLGLVSLSFLWRRDQSELLKEVIESGLEAVVVKTASWGLIPQKHCGKTLRQLYSVFEKLVSGMVLWGLMEIGESGCGVECMWRRWRI